MSLSVQEEAELTSIWENYTNNTVHEGAMCGLCGVSTSVCWCVYDKFKSKMTKDSLKIYNTIESADEKYIFVFHAITYPDIYTAQNMAVVVKHDQEKEEKDKKIKDDLEKQFAGWNKKEDPEEKYYRMLWDESRKDMGFICIDCKKCKMSMSYCECDYPAFKKKVTKLQLSQLKDKIAKELQDDIARLQKEKDELLGSLV